MTDGKLIRDEALLKENIEEIDQINNDKEKYIDKKPEYLIKALRKFNCSPDDGIKYILESKILHESKIATFLFDNNDLLNKVKLGEYLGELENLDILKTFVGLHDFFGKRFDVALRMFLSSFRLPGEAQKIDRIMELFAARYCSCNEAVETGFTSDSAYIFAFSIIMLNTDLHNPAVKNKITKQTFIRNNQRVLPSLSKEVFSNVYNSILNEPLKMFDENETSECPFYLSLCSPEREGWLTKQGGRYKNWKRRYCVLTGSCLYYFKEDLNKNNNQNPLGIVPLENLLVEEIEIEGSKKKKFKIFSPDSADDSRIKAAKTQQNGVIIEGFHKSYVFYCDNHDERSDWINSIRAQMNNSPMYQMYKERVNKVESIMALNQSLSSIEFAQTQENT